MSRKVLFVCHNHPDLLVGGVEMYTARPLRGAARVAGEFEPDPARPCRPSLLRADEPATRTRRSRMVNARPEPVPALHRLRRLRLLLRAAGRPGSRLTVHSATSSRASSPTSSTSSTPRSSATTSCASTRNALPDAPIVYTLHEYMPICHRDGQMVRAQDGASCARRSRRAAATSASPTITPQAVLHAQALHPVAPRAGRPLHRAERVRARSATSSGGSRRSGSWSSRRASACRSRDARRRTQPAAPAAQPVRLLRPAQPLQGSRRAAARRWTCWARTSTATSGSTERTSTSRPPSWQERFGELLETTGRT